MSAIISSTQRDEGAMMGRAILLHPVFFQCEISDQLARWGAGGQVRLINVFKFRPLSPPSSFRYGPAAATRKTGCLHTCITPPSAPTATSLPRLSPVRRLKR